MEDNIFPIFYTHNTYYEGDGKIHLFNEKTGKCLCGFDIKLFFEVDYKHDFKTLNDYVMQPDPDGCFCKRCKNIFLRKK